MRLCKCGCNQEIPIHYKKINYIQGHKVKNEISILCKCGCGLMTKLGKVFINGHNSKGVKLSISTIEKRSKSHTGSKHRKSIEIKTDETCQFGCNKKASYILLSGKLCCESSSNGCPVVKEKKLNASIEIKTSELCSYGCGNIANYKLKNGNLCCQKLWSECNTHRDFMRNIQLTDNIGKKYGYKISIAKKGCPSSRKGIPTGIIPWSKGKTGVFSKETLKKIGEGSKKKIFTEEYREKLRIAGTGQIQTKETIDKRINTRIKLGQITPYELLDEQSKYRKKVDYFTRLSIKKYFTEENLKNIGPTGKEGAEQIDHNYSVITGFINNISPYIIGHICNLRIISWEENSSKCNRCDITLDELCENIENFELVYKDDKDDL